MKQENESLVFRLLFDRLKDLGFQVSEEAKVAQGIYSSKLLRDDNVFDVKCIVMGNKGIIHVMMGEDLKSLQFDIDDLIKDDKIDSSKMNGLLSKVQNGLFHSLSKVSTVETDYGQRSRFGVGDKDLDPLAAAPGILPPRFGGIGGGGMIMDPSHPLFTQPPQFYPSGTGPMTFPQGSIPPGVRFDPVTPLGPRFPMGTRPPGRPGFPRGTGPWSGEPDQDEFLPPGNNMYM